MTRVGASGTASAVAVIRAAKAWAQVRAVGEFIIASACGAVVVIDRLARPAT